MYYALKAPQARTHLFANRITARMRFSFDFYLNPSAKPVLGKKWSEIVISTRKAPFRRRSRNGGRSMFNLKSIPVRFDSIVVSSAGRATTRCRLPTPHNYGRFYPSPTPGRMKPVQRKPLGCSQFFPVGDFSPKNHLLTLFFLTKSIP